MNATFVALVAALGTPVLGLLIYLFNRRATLRSIDATTDSAHVTAAAQIVGTLQSQVDRLIKRQEESDEDARVERVNFTNQLNQAHIENSRINALVAQLQTDLDITHRQIVALRQHLPANLPDNTQMLFEE